MYVIQINTDNATQSIKNYTLKKFTLECHCANPWHGIRLHRRVRNIGTAVQGCSHQQYSLAQNILYRLHCTHTHTHTHPFHGPLSGTSDYPDRKVKPIWILLMQETVSVAVAYMLGYMQVCTSLQTGNHASTPPLSFLQAACPSCCATNSDFIANT